MKNNSDRSWNTQAINHLAFLFGEDKGRETYQRLISRITSHRFTSQTLASQFSQRDIVLITYSDQVQAEADPPLATLADFCERWLKGTINCLHLLPFYPSSSDDGFSVVDYCKVYQTLGTWQHIDRLASHFRLMFDAVINHISAESTWFQEYLRGNQDYKDYFIVVEGQPNLSTVFRPRALPLLTKFDTRLGGKWLWTTFSADQVDLNYHNPDVLVEVVNILFYYIKKGAYYIRLDAIAFLWKEIGTRCLHLQQTHRIIQLFRILLNHYAPHVCLVTETNVPHEENLSYFGDGYDEAHMVYNFALPPLILHTFYQSDVSVLSHWVSNLHLPSSEVTFFNFLASHDGIGLTALQGLLTSKQVNSLVSQTRSHGGLVSYRKSSHEQVVPYEININYFDALSNPHSSEPMEIQVKRFLAAHAILFSLSGVVGVYFHSMFGSCSWFEGAAESDQKRRINRQKLQVGELESELSDPHSRRVMVFQGMKRLSEVRAQHAAFNPVAGQQVLACGNHVFALLRISPVGDEEILCLSNVSNIPVELFIISFGLSWEEKNLIDLISGKRVPHSQNGMLLINPYQYLWLTPESNCIG